MAMAILIVPEVNALQVSWLRAGENTIKWIRGGLIVFVFSVYWESWGGERKFNLKAYLYVLILFQEKLRALMNLAAKV